ncbi:hypothetical protein PGT21_006449 [Puccinia graminis f. sp. tritici]|uniref:Golgi to ER traffic-protein n=1 Tax=Puccinia graminis f. sp. tritici TaxID=56615 RepID=A0A5B0NKF7_PUCGR|nr:hypothetical protein PGT21_006449 [Puccinia graminis f. sp. tritici]
MGWFLVTLYSTLLLIDPALLSLSTGLPHEGKSAELFTLPDLNGPPVSSQGANDRPAPWFDLNEPPVDECPMEDLPPSQRTASSSLLPTIATPSQGGASSSLSPTIATPSQGTSSSPLSPTIATPSATLLQNPVGQLPGRTRDYLPRAAKRRKLLASLTPSDHTLSGYTSPGHASSAHASSDHASSDHASSDHASSDHAMSDDASSGYTSSDTGNSDEMVTIRFIPFSTDKRRKTGLKNLNLSDVGKRRHKDLYPQLDPREKRRLSKMRTQNRLVTAEESSDSDVGASNSEHSPSSFEKIMDNLARKIKEPIAQENLDSNLPKLSKEASESFDLQDWSFLKLVPQRKRTDEEPLRNCFPQELFKILMSSDGEEGKNYFWIERFDLKRRFNAFQKAIPKLKFPLEFDPFSQDKKATQAVMYGVYLMLSERKLVLDSYPSFYLDIVGNLENKLELKMRNLNQLKAQKKRLPTNIKTGDRSRFIHEKKIKKIIKYVKESTQIATFMVIVHLSLFKEHDQEFLTPQAIRKILGFFQNLWLKLESGQSSLIEKYPWAKRNWSLLTLENPHRLHVDFIRNPEDVYRMAFNFVGYWAKKNGKGVKGYGSSDHFTNVIATMDWMVYYSNYEIISGSLKRRIKRTQQGED